MRDFCAALGVQFLKKRARFRGSLVNVSFQEFFHVFAPDDGFSLFNLPSSGIAVEKCWAVNRFRAPANTGSLVEWKDFSFA